MAKRPSRQEKVASEFDGVRLGDPRRSRRAMEIARRLAAQPEASLPDAMLDPGMLEAVYRHLSSKQVSFETLIEPHIQKSAARVERATTAYAVHDTTECAFRGETQRDGLGPMAERQGFLAHATLAVSADGTRTPLGVLAIELIVREGKKPKLTSMERKHDEHRESLRWGRGVDASSARVEDPSRLVHVADREGDIYELLTKLVQEKRRFIIRAAQNRTVFVERDGVDRLFDAARQTPQTFTLEVPLSRRIAAGSKSNPARGSRIATLSFAALSLHLREPKQRSGAPAPYALRVNVVHVFERRPPVGEMPVEWLLLTTESIKTRDDIERIVEGYRTRWTIEEYFKAIKTGCAYESRQLESFHSLANMLAYTLVVAYALLLMRALSRTGQEEPASDLLDEQELAVLRRKLKLSAKVDVRTALLAIASLGGHIKNNGDPGWQVLSRGWRRLRDYVEGYRLANATSDQS